MTYTGIIKTAVELSSAGQTKLSEQILELPGMSSSKGRSLLNYLVFDGAKYLEIGVYKGSTFSSALYGNTPSAAFAIDDWSWTKNPANATDIITIETFKPIVDTCVPGAIYTVIEKDAFSVDEHDLQGNKFNVYFYDGDHSWDSQAKAITHYYPFLEDEFILIVDDYDWGAAKGATESALKQMNIAVLFDIILSTDSKRNGAHAGWWMGYYVAHCKK
jgi:hypothetical protein